MSRTLWVWCLYFDDVHSEIASERPLLAAPQSYLCGQDARIRLAPTLTSHRINAPGIVPGFFTTSIGGGLLIDLENEMTRQFVIALIIVATIAVLVAGAVVGLILFLPTILLSVAELTTAAIVTGVIAGLILLPFLIIAAAVLGTFNHAYWTLAYLRITATESVPRSSRVM